MKCLLCAISLIWCAGVVRASSDDYKIPEPPSLDHLLDDTSPSPAGSPTSADNSPLSAYKKAISAMVGTHWKALISQHLDDLDSGSWVTIDFVLFPSGKLRSVKILKSNSDLLGSLSVQAIKETSFPPFDKSILKKGSQPVLMISYSFSIKGA
jgi:hypothetical protein